MGLTRLSAMCRELQDDASRGRLLAAADMISRVAAIETAAKDAIDCLRATYPECDMTAMAAMTIQPAAAAAVSARNH